MPDIKLSEIKTKNKKKDKIVVSPTQIPLFVEKEFHANMRAFNVAFKKAVREQLFPIIEQMSKQTRDTVLTLDGIGDDLNNAIELLKAQFNFNTAAEIISNRMVSRVNLLNGTKTAAKVANAVGVDIGNIIASEGLTDFLEAQTIKNTELIKSIPADSLNDIRRIMLNGFTQGLRAEEITKQISGNLPSSVFNKMNNRINTIARTGIAQVNSQITNKRLLNIGVTRAVWDATNDSRVRECHKARDGKEYEIKVGLHSSCDNKTLQPGEEINCRCVARPIVE